MIDANSEKRLTELQVYQYSYRFFIVQIVFPNYLENQLHHSTFVFVWNEDRNDSEEGHLVRQIF